MGLSIFPINMFVTKLYSQTLLSEYSKCHLYNKLIQYNNKFTS